MTDRPLTQREQELLQLIVAFVSERGYPPTREELMARTGRSRHAVDRPLLGLRNKGRVALDGGWRALRILGLRWRPEPAA